MKWWQYVLISLGTLLVLYGVNLLAIYTYFEIYGVVGGSQIISEKDSVTTRIEREVNNNNKEIIRTIEKNNNTNTIINNLPDSLLIPDIFERARDLDTTDLRQFETDR